jgi:hypothetical protein
MLKDSTNLMYDVFQSCRHALRQTTTALNLLIETLEMVKHQETLLIEVSDDWVTTNQLRKRTVTLNAEEKLAYRLSPANQKMFTMIDVGTRELQRLWASESTNAVRCLGYAFHNIPALLLKPDEFRACLNIRDEPRWAGQNRLTHFYRILLGICRL